MVALNLFTGDFYRETLQVSRYTREMGSFQDPDVCDYNNKTMTNWGRSMFVTPSVVIDGNLVTTDLVDINLNIRILLSHFYYDGWDNAEPFVKTDPVGNPVDQKHPLNQTTVPRPQKRDFNGKYSWVMCPRWLDKSTGDHLALDTGGGAFARLWATALANIVDMSYVKVTGNSVVITLPKTALKPAVTFEWKIPKWSNAIERDRARAYFQPEPLSISWSRPWPSCKPAAPRL